jgi:hypothetical protein
MAVAEQSAVERLEGLGVPGILLQMARDGQIVEVRCEMAAALLLQRPQELRSQVASFRLVPDA